MHRLAVGHNCSLLHAHGIGFGLRFRVYVAAQQRRHRAKICKIQNIISHKKVSKAESARSSGWVTFCAMQSEDASTGPAFIGALRAIPEAVSVSVRSELRVEALLGVDLAEWWCTDTTLPCGSV